MTVLEGTRDNIAGLSHSLLMAVDARRSGGGERALLTDPVEARLDLSDRRVRLTIERPEAEWIYPVLARMQALDRLPENWDSYDGRPIGGDVLVQAIQVLASIMDDDTPAPWIVPTSDGGVQLEWHDEPRSFEVTIDPSLRVSVFFADDNEEVEITDVPPSQATVLRNLLTRTVGLRD